MIIAEIVPLQNDTFLVRFSEPDENFGSKPFTAAVSRFDIERRVALLNRAYIVGKLISWLNQRSIAVGTSPCEISTIAKWLNTYRSTSLKNICSYITNKRAEIEKVVPSESSKCHQYYIKTILPILDFCTGNNETNSEHD